MRFIHPITSSESVLSPSLSGHDEILQFYKTKQMVHTKRNTMACLSNAYISVAILTA